MNNAAPTLDVQTKVKNKIFILNVAEQVTFSLTPEEEKGSASL